jgi:aryl-alcohol dehydrogenase-like predicted oxidoreductase
MEGLERLKGQGKIRAAGISNYGQKQMWMLEDTGKFDLLEAHQLPYSLFFRAIEYGVQKKCVEKNLGIICYSTLAQGLLSGKFNSIEDVPEHLKVLRFYTNPDNVKAHGGPGCEEEAFAAVRALKPICDEAGLTMPQACLAWLFKQKGVTSLLTGPRTVDELMQNIECVETDLSDELAAKMTEASEPVRIKLGANTDMWFKGERARSF